MKPGEWRAQIAAMPEDTIGRSLAEAAFETSTFRWTIKREEIQPDRTFSREAMDTVGAQMMAFVEARIMARWDTGEPPSHLEITLIVDAA